MAKIIWTEPAIAELDEVADYIALDNPDAAKNLVNKIFNKISKLKTFPALGQKVRDLAGQEYRVVTVSPCRIYYRVDGAKIYVLYVRGKRS